jgi:P2 family phage contractile tail tube protein
MAMPRILKNFNVFNDGINYVGIAQKVKLPDLKRVMEKYRGGGMNGPISVDLGQDELSAEHEYGGPERQIFEQWGITTADGVLLRFAGALQRDNDGSVTAVEVIMRGRHSEANFPEAEGGKQNTFKVKTALTYFKYSEDGNPIIEIDLINMIEIVNGTDRLAEQRKAIGLA